MTCVFVALKKNQFVWWLTFGWGQIYYYFVWKKRSIWVLEVRRARQRQPTHLCTSLTINFLSKCAKNATICSKRLKRSTLCPTPNGIIVLRQVCDIKRPSWRNSVFLVSLISERYGWRERWSQRVSVCLRERTNKLLNLRTGNTHSVSCKNLFLRAKVSGQLFLVVMRSGHWWWIVLLLFVVVVPKQTKQNLCLFHSHSNCLQIGRLWRSTGLGEERSTSIRPSRRSSRHAASCGRFIHKSVFVVCSMFRCSTQHRLRESLCDSECQG